jgi:hypothetical protein
MALSPEQRTQRARLAAHAMHAQGKTNTQPARDALLRKFEDDVDPDRTLTPAERAKRVEHARKEYYTRLSFLASKAREKAAS